MSMPGKASDCLLLRPSIKRDSYEEGAAGGPFVVTKREGPGETKLEVRYVSYVVTLCCMGMLVGTDCCSILKVAAVCHEEEKARCVPIPPCYALPAIPKPSHLHRIICGTADLTGFPGCCWISAYLKLESPVFEMVYLHLVDANFLDLSHLTQMP